LISVDVSEFQVPVNDSYPHRWLIFRACDGGYVDHNVTQNLAWAIRARADGRLDGFTVYVVYRPGANDVILARLNQVGVPTDCVVMIDAETWQGQITGDRSTEMNLLAASLARRQGSPDRVWGYFNRGDGASMWPGRPSWLQVVVASYGGSSPTGIANMVGWQYTDGQPQFAVSGLPSSSPPFGPCDHNELNVTATPQGDAPMTPAEIQAVADAVWAKAFSGVMPDGKTLSPQHKASEWLAGTNLAERDDATSVELAAVKAAVLTLSAAVARLSTGGAVVGTPPTYTTAGPLTLTPMP